MHSGEINSLLPEMNANELQATGATWIGTSVKSQKPLSGEELARLLNEAIQQNAAASVFPTSIQPIQGAARPGIVTMGFVVVWGARPE